MAVGFVLCADDYAMSPAVSRGVLACAMDGAISAASAMANLPDFSRAADQWQACAPPADLGLHVNLTVGSALSGPSRLAPDGRFRPLGVLIASGLAGEAPREDLQNEIGAQIDAFLKTVGAAPTHIDGHQHVQGLSFVWPALLAALEERGLREVWLRDSADSLMRIFARRAMIGKALKVKALTRSFRAAAIARGFSLNDSFAGYSNFIPGAYGPKTFGSYLNARGAKHLVMCHPGYVDDELRALDSVTITRETELAFLRSQEFMAVLQGRQARLVRHRDWRREAALSS